MCGGGCESTGSARLEATHHARNDLAGYKGKNNGMQVHYVKHINFRDHPEILLLKKENEEVNDLLRLSPEEILLRWVNYHLAANKSKRVVKNLGKDLKDLEGY